MCIPEYGLVGQTATQMHPPLARPVRHRPFPESLPLPLDHFSSPFYLLTVSATVTTSDRVAE